MRARSQCQPPREAVGHEYGKRASVGGGCPARIMQVADNENCLAREFHVQHDRACAVLSHIQLGILDATARPILEGTGLLVQDDRRAGVKFL